MADSDKRARAMTAADLARAAAHAGACFADGGAVDDSERPYKVTGSKVWLSRTAKEFARTYGLSDAEMARYLMQQERLREAGVTDADVPRFGETEDPDWAAE